MRFPYTSKLTSTFKCMNCDAVTESSIDMVMNGHLEFPPPPAFDSGWFQWFHPEYGIVWSCPKHEAVVTVKDKD